VIDPTSAQACEFPLPLRRLIALNSAFIMKRHCSFGLLLLASGLPLCAADSHSFALRDGDRVVFYGDSITDQRLYTTFTETYVVTRFPKMNVTFVHSGWGGDRVTGGGGGKIDERLERDVFAYRPTVMTIMLGMNDASYRPFDPQIFATYTNGYQHIVESVKEHIPNIRLTLIQPSPFDDVTRAPNFEGGYNAVLIKYGEFVKELARREHAAVADLNTGVTEAVKKANETNHELAIKINPDRVHPSAGGHLLMAGELLKAWHAPAVVTLVEIDASAKKAEHAEGAKVSDLTAGESITWTQKDEALPMWVDFKDPVVALAVNSSDFMDSLNRQMLRVTGLNAGNYTLKIDGETVGTFPKEKLADGINLAAYATPMSKQAQQVHQLTLQHNDIHFVRWRQVQLKTKENLPHMKQALEGLDALEKDMVQQQRAAAQPRPHKYELSPAS
jgi:lysophospholipase L1-like esterase